MNRRDILTILGGTLVLGGTLCAKVQSAPTVHRIGVLGPGLLPDAAERERVWVHARELGWIEGQNVIVERRFAGNKLELLQPYAEELVRLNAEIIFTYGTPATIAAKNATTRIPIVMLGAGDPVRAGLVASLARPGGNVTGFSIIAPELEVKRIRLLHELLPTVQRVGRFDNPTNPYTKISNEYNEQAFRSLGIQTVFFEFTTFGELENAVVEARRRGAQALIIDYVNDYTSRDRAQLMRTALRQALPTITDSRDMLEAGAVMCLTIDPAEQERNFSYFLNQILRGAKPADLPVRQPSRFVLSINLKTAKALGITVPQSLLQRADEVIQ